MDVLKGIFEAFGVADANGDVVISTMNFISAIVGKFKEFTDMIFNDPELMGLIQQYMSAWIEYYQALLNPDVMKYTTDLMKIQLQTNAVMAHLWTAFLNLSAVIRPLLEDLNGIKVIIQFITIAVVGLIESLGIFFKLLLLSIDDLMHPMGLLTGQRHVTMDYVTDKLPKEWQAWNRWVYPIAVLS